MASANKTPKLGLNQWAAGDEVLRTDFNADNAKLEAFATGPVCVTGRLMGDGVYPRAVNLGFKPSFLIYTYDLPDAYEDGVRFMASSNGMCFTDTETTTKYRPVPDQYIEFTANGFVLKELSYANTLNQEAQYVAFR